MKTIHTDERFPGIEIVNHGNNLFQVRENGAVMSTFESWERPDGTITEAFAARRAQDYFARQNAMDAVPEYPDGKTAVTEGKVTARDIDRMLAVERIELDPQKKSVIREQLIRQINSEQTVAEAVVSYLIEV